MIRHRQTALLTLGAGMLWGLTGCGGDGSTPSTSAPTTINAPFKILEKSLGQIDNRCRLTLDRTQAAFGDILTVKGLPDTMGAANIRVIAQQGQTAHVGAAFFIQNDQGGMSERFYAPLHPANPAQGGRVMLEVGDGKIACPAIALDLASVVAADVANIQRINSKLNTWVDLNIRLFGLDPTALQQAQADDVRPEYIPFAVAKKLLANQGELTAQAQDLTRNNNRLYAGLLHQVQLEAALDQAIAELERQPVPSKRSTAPHHAQVLGARRPSELDSRPVSLPVWNPTAIQTRSTRNAAFCEIQKIPANPLPIFTAAELSAQMLAAQEGYVFSENRQNSAGQSLGLLGTTAAFGELNSAGAATTHASNALLVIKSVENAKRALVPNQITEFQIGNYDSLLVEDRPASQAGLWQRASVYAQGKSFNLSSVSLETLVSLVGMVPGPVGLGTGATTAVFSQSTNNLINSLTEDSCFEIEAPRYGPIDVSDATWTTFSVEGEAVKKLTQRSYIGQAIGSADLVFKLNSEKFASNRIFRETRNVVVAEQQVSVSPSRSTVAAAGDTVELQATIPNAFTDKSNLSASVTSGDASIVSEQRQGDTYTLRVKTSTLRDAFPVRVTFRAHNPTLPANAIRTADAVIDTRGAISLSSASSCLTPNTTIELNATISGFAANQRGMDWSVTGAQLVSTKTNADGSISTATIRTTSTGAPVVQVTSRADNSVKASTTLNVSSSCLKKALYVGMGVTSSQSGIDSDGSTGCASAQTPDDFIKQFQTPEGQEPRLPNIPPNAQLWFDRTERVLVDNHVSNIAYQRDDGTGIGCKTVNTSASIPRADLQVYGKNDGSLGFVLDSELTAECKPHQDELVCNSSNALLSMAGFYFLDIAEDTRFLLEGELQCNGLTGVVALQPMSVIADRYEQGNGGFVQYVPNNLSQSLIADRNNNPLPPVLWGDVTCTQANQTIRLNQEVVFKAPRQRGTTDRMVISLLGNATALANGTTKQGFKPLGSGGISELTPKAGSFSTKAKVSFFVRVTPQ